MAIPFSEVHELLAMIHDILDNFLSNQVGSRQSCGVWASQFPILHNIHDVVSPSEACLYDSINWPLAQAQ